MPERDLRTCIFGTQQLAGGVVGSSYTAQGSVRAGGYNGCVRSALGGSGGSRI